MSSEETSHSASPAVAIEGQELVAVVKRGRWTSIAILFICTLMHQTDRALISPLTTPIMETFGINEAQMGAVTTGALIVGAIFYPIWGYLFDRYARPKILALASFIWGATTWLGAIAPTYGTFVAARASTGVDDASYSGIYSLVADHFGPKQRGKIIAMMQLAFPVAFVLATSVAIGLRNIIGWRAIFYITGGLGVLVSFFIFAFVKEAPRGQAEPEMEGFERIGAFRFDWEEAKRLFQNMTLRSLFFVQFVLLFPVQALTFWFFRYMEVERGLPDDQVYITSMLFLAAGIVGYLLAGSTGDWAFRRSTRGRVLVGSAGVLLAGITIPLSVAVPLGQTGLFMILMSLGALFMNFAHPNVVSTVQEVVPPEVRNSAQSLMGIVEQAGSALAPLLVGIVAVSLSLKMGLIIICASGFILSASLLLITSRYVHVDVEAFRSLMRERARQASSAGGKRSLGEG